MSDTIARQAQLPEQDAIIELFSVDMTDNGGSIVYWVTGPLNGASVYFDSVEYIPLPIQASGFEYNGQGQFPTPTLSVSNLNTQVISLIINYNDMLGARVTRTRTFFKHLDDQSDPDPTQTFPIDCFYINQKSKHTQSEVEFTLKSSIDLYGTKLPKRLILKNTCTHRYRYYSSDDADFDYTDVTCPYTGSSYYTQAGDTTTDPSEDSCGRRISDCILRFGDDDTLPTRAFPGLTRYS